MQRIEADLLIVGTADTIKKGCVVIDGGKISYAGTVEGSPKPTGSDTTVSVPVVMPGMWEAHGHFTGLKTANLDEGLRTSIPVLAGRCVRDAERALAAGFTSVREVGGFGVHLARLIDEGTVNGPHVYGSGAILSQTGGHGDYHSFPLDFVVQAAESIGMGALCDGVPECLKAVRKQLRLDVKVIKICASGGVMSEVDHPVHQQFSDEEQAAIVQEAARAERVVAAHCHGKPGIMAALKAGCATIEHGSYLDEESADLMLRKGAILVPTRFIVERLQKFAKTSGLPEISYRKLVAGSDAHKQAMRLAVKKGLKVALGTDIFSSGDESVVPWGMNGNELGYLVEAGMTPLQAIQAATSMGPQTLGPQAPLSGVLRTGYDADVIALAANPLQDVSVLTGSKNVTHVWKAGKLVKHPSGS